MKMRCAFVGLLCGTILHAAEPADPALWDPVVTAVQKVVPAVVNISTERLVARQFRDPFEDFWRQFFGQPRRPEGGGGQSLGSGVIVDEDGWLVTNWHVVRRATKITVILADRTKYEARYVSGAGDNDLALLKIDAATALPFVELGTDREPFLGETVIAVGNPFGLEHTVTKGIISAKNRRHEAGEIVFEDILQTDAAINPGNSGGPLVNLRGQLVGINMAILSQAEGIGFAIPAPRVARLLTTWLTPEKRSRLWLGVRFAREQEKLVIADVQPDSPAARAGLAAKDIVKQVDGEVFAEPLKVQRHLLRKKEGDTVKFAVERSGEPVVAEVKLAGLPQVSAIELMQRRFGLQVQEMTSELAGALGLPMVPGLLVADVEAKTPAFEGGLRRGMILTHMGGEEIQSLERLADQLLDLKANDKVAFAVFLVERRGNMVLQRTASVTVPAR